MTSSTSAQLLDPARLEGLRKLGEQLGTDIYGETLADVARECGLKLEALRAAASAGDTRTLATVAHGLCSVAAAVGASELIEACRALEERALETELEPCRPLLEAVEAASEQTVRSVRELLAQRVVRHES